MVSFLRYNLLNNKYILTVKFLNAFAMGLIGYKYKKIEIYYRLCMIYGLILIYNNMEWTYATKYPIGASKSIL